MHYFNKFNCLICFFLSPGLNEGTKTIWLSFVVIIKTKGRSNVEIIQRINQIKFEKLTKGAL